MKIKLLKNQSRITWSCHYFLRILKSLQVYDIFWISFRRFLINIFFFLVLLLYMLTKRDCFLGCDGPPFKLQTNVFANDNGGREQRINLWFDPTQDFHKYGILWKDNQIVYVTKLYIYIYICMPIYIRHLFFPITLYM